MHIVGRGSKNPNFIRYNVINTFSNITIANFYHFAIERNFFHLKSIRIVDEYEVINKFIRLKTQTELQFDIFHIFFLYSNWPKNICRHFMENVNIYSH